MIPLAAPCASSMLVSVFFLEDKITVWVAERVRAILPPTNPVPPVISTVLIAGIMNN